MAKYTEEEVKQFRLKDKRMSLSGITQALIHAGINVWEVDKNVELATRYSNKIYEIAEREVSTETKETIETSCVSIWEKAAEETGWPVPSDKEQLILNLVREAAGNIDANTVLSTIQKKYGKYPTVKSSIKKCVEVLKN